MKIKLKDKVITEYKIIIRTNREQFKENNGYSWGKSIWMCDLDKGYMKTMFSAYTEKELFDRILSELYLKPLTFKQKILKKLTKWLR